MNLLETIRLSISAILRNRLRSFLTILGIVIGVLSVIVLIALVNGLQSYITGQISSFGSNLVLVVPGNPAGGRGPGGAVVNRLETQDVDDLKRKITPDEAAITAVIQKVSSVKNQNKNVTNVSIFGVDATYGKIVTSIKIKQGRFLNESESDSGRRVAVIGPTIVTELFNGGNAIGKDISINNVKYQVVGVLEARGSTFGQDQDKTALVPLVALKKQFSINNLNGIYISVKQTDQIKVIQEKAKAVISKRISADDFTVTTQEQALSTINQITGVLAIALGGIAAISLLVGGIGVMNIMLVSVTERTREIGLRKALGAKDKDIRNQFLIEALTLSGLGGILGILLGVGICLIINIFFTTTITAWSIALSFGFSMLVGVIFGVTPAIRASRLDPITALRYE